MSDQMNSNPAPDNRVQINYDEVPAKPAPILEVGALAWMRKNLFNTPLDAFLTILGIVLTVVTTIGLIQWSITTADWFAVTYNLKRFMVGNLPFPDIWRVSMVVLFASFAAGITLAAYSRRLSPFFGIMLVLVFAPVFLIPPFADSIPEQTAYYVAGNQTITSGTSEQVPIEQVAFIANEGDVITFDYADFVADSDSPEFQSIRDIEEQIGQVNGFIDRAANNLRNGAANRITTIDRYHELEALIKEDQDTIADGRELGVFTEEQRNSITGEFESLFYEYPPENQERLDEITVILDADTEKRDTLARSLSDGERRSTYLARLLVSTLDEDPASTNELSGFVPLGSLDELLAFLEPIKVEASAYVDQYVADIQQQNLDAAADDNDDTNTTLLPTETTALWSQTFSNRSGDSELQAILADLTVENFEQFLLDDATRLELRNESDYLSFEPPVSEAFNLNNVSVQIRILDNNSEDIGLEGMLSPDGDSISFTMPYGGWYVLEKTVEGDETGIALLATTGLYPVFDRTIGDITEFIRVSDDFTVFALADDNIELSDLPESDQTRITDRSALPTLESGDDMPYMRLLENQFRGERDFNTYMKVYLGTFMWRIGDAVFQMLIVGILGFIAGRLLDRFMSPRETPRSQSRRASTWFLIATPIFMIVYISGAEFLTPTGLNPTDPRDWGGLLLTMFITIYGIILAFPLGIGLALGRRSDLPAIKYLCTMIIEVVRGTPFIVVLFAGQLLIPFITLELPILGTVSFAEIPNAYRALGSTVIFIAAYLAENVRGGLQSIPPGQEEAARAVGLSNWQVIIFITLPQALRAVIPALVGQFISLFKDTSLLTIVGLIDLTNVVNNLVAQAEFNDARREGLIFISIIYFVFSYIMSYVSRRIEESGSGSARRI